MDIDEFYEQCGLTDNPFRQNADLEADPRADIWVGFPEQQEALTRVLEKCMRKRGRTQFVLLYGTWGTGKSHSLLWVRHQVLHKQAAHFNSSAYYIRTLKVEDKVSFAHAFNHFIVERSRFVRDVMEFRQWLSERIVEHKAANNLGPDISNEQVISSFYADVDYRGVATGIFHSEDKDALLDEFDLHKLKDYKAMHLFATIIKLFTHTIEINGIEKKFRNAVYLLIDELDDLDRASVKERLQTSDLLRDFYDLVPTNLCIIGGLSLAAGDVDTIFPDYVLERIKKRILMSHFTAGDAKLFVQRLLECHRTNGGPFAPFFPFEEVAVDSVINRLPEERMTPRRIIEIFDEILDGANDADFDFSTPEITLEFLEDEGIMEDVLE